MQFIAKSKFLRCSPYKLRAYADVVRGKGAQYALNWLGATSLERIVPLRKTIASAVANASSSKGLRVEELVVKEVCVDEGPRHRYYRPGAMGRSNIYKKRLSHIKVVLEAITNKER